MPFIAPKSDNPAKIKVVGVGGGGQNAVNTMVNMGDTYGVEFIAMNTDLQALSSCLAPIKLQLGPERTHGLGSGADPQVGAEAAVESTQEISKLLDGADMVFVTAGLGGGTGTGAGPMVSKIAKDLGILTVGVVTKPFVFEGKRRMNQAEAGIAELKNTVDALIVIPNEKLLEVVEEKTSMLDAFKIVDKVVGNAVKGISDLITSPGLINVDFADVKSIMSNAGSALMGIGSASGENRAEKAARMAINSPLLGVDIKGSTGILMNIVGDNTLTMHEVNLAAKLVSEAASENANIIFGASIDTNVDGVQVTVIATGFDTDFKSIAVPVTSSAISGKDILEQFDSRFDSIKKRPAIAEPDLSDVAGADQELNLDSNIKDFANEPKEFTSDDHDEFTVSGIEDIADLRKKFKKEVLEMDRNEQTDEPTASESKMDGLTQEDSKKSSKQAGLWNFLRERK